MRFKHTEQTAKVYNSMIKEYREISCDLYNVLIYTLKGYFISSFLTGIF